MVEKADVKVKKNWFIRTKNEKIEDVYKFDVKKDVNFEHLMHLILMIFIRNLVKAHTEMSSRDTLRKETILEQSKLSQRIKSKTKNDSNWKSKLCAISYMIALLLF